MKRITLQNIADHLGLNQSTVSRGLQDDPRIPTRTRQRIRSACAKLGYRPDSMLSELAAARWQMDSDAQGRVIAYISTLAPGRAMADLGKYLLPPAAVLGYRLEVFHRAEYSSSLRLQRVLRNRGITEVILGPVHEKSLAVQLDWTGFICVQLLPGFFLYPLHSVVRDHFNAVTLAWRKAVEYGYQRIGITLFDHPFQLMDDVMRRSAVFSCQHLLFRHLAAINPFHFDQDSQRNEEGFLTWVEHNDLDAIIDFTTTYEYLRPKMKPDIGYISLHTRKALGFSGVPDYIESCAVEGINLLHYCRRTHQWGIPDQRIDHVIEPKWIDGNSLPRRKS